MIPGLNQIQKLESASPGGWLRAFGRSIGYGEKAFVEFRGGGENRRSTGSTKTIRRARF